MRGRQGATEVATTPRSSTRAILVIVLGGALVAAAIGVHGEFPLNDDASYAYATQTLCTTGTLRFLPWTAPSLVFQAAYGAVLCQLFGFSFTVLRVSTVVLAVAGVVGFFLLVRRLGVRGAALGFATALFAFNPLYLSLAFTFMTDVPFTVLVVWAAYAYVGGLNDRRVSRLLAGAVFATAALLVRQHGILVAAAAAGAALMARTWPAAERWRGAAISLFLPAATFVAFHFWIVGVSGVPVGYGSRLGQLGDLSLATVANSGFRGLCYLGLFATPLLWALAPQLLRRHRRLVFAGCTVLALTALGLFVRERAAMFYLTNVLYDFGLGALTLRDTLFLGYDPPGRLGAPFTIPLTLVALVGTGLLAAAWASAVGQQRAPGATFLHLGGALFFAATLLQSRYYLDRHLLTVVPFVLAATIVAHPLAAVPRRALLLLALVAWYSVAGTHDYLAWNRARFAGLAALTAEGIAPAAIDGGVEFNAWHLAPALGTWPSDAEVRPGQPDTAKSWWWVVDDRFVASFRPLPGYALRTALTYRRWLVPGTGRVLILERDAVRPE